MITLWPSGHSSCDGLRCCICVGLPCNDFLKLPYTTIALAQTNIGDISPCTASTLSLSRT